MQRASAFQFGFGCYGLPAKVNMLHGNEGCNSKRLGAKHLSEYILILGAKSFRNIFQEFYQFFIG